MTLVWLIPALQTILGLGQEFWLFCLFSPTHQSQPPIYWWPLPAHGAAITLEAPAALGGGGAPIGKMSIPQGQGCVTLGATCHEVAPCPC